MAFGSQPVMSTTEQNSTCQWKLDVRKDMAVGYDDQPGNLTTVK